MWVDMDGCGRGWICIDMVRYGYSRYEMGMGVFKRCMVDDCAMYAESQLCELEREGEHC